MVPFDPFQLGFEISIAGVEPLALLLKKLTLYEQIMDLSTHLLKDLPLANEVGYRVIVGNRTCGRPRGSDGGRLGVD